MSKVLKEIRYRKPSVSKMSGAIYPLLVLWYRRFMTSIWNIFEIRRDMQFISTSISNDTYPFIEVWDVDIDSILVPDIGVLDVDIDVSSISYGFWQFWYRSWWCWYRRTAFYIEKKIDIEELIEETLDIVWGKVPVFQMEGKVYCITGFPRD